MPFTIKPVVEILLMLVLIGLLASPVFGQAPRSFQFYYLTIGSANYQQDPVKFTDPDFVPFDNLPEANLSAKVMSALFEKEFSAKGNTFTSSDPAMVSKQRIMAQLDALSSRIRKDGAQHPFVLFYYCGHGISENMGWNQFFVPGSYTKVTTNQSFDDISRQLIFLGDITDYFSKKKFPYMVLVDCCRKQTRDSSLPEKRMSYFFNEQALQTFKIVIQGLKYLNEYHQPNPVVFAIAPGSLAPTVPLPPQSFFILPENTQPYTGPLCRRSILAVQAFEQSANANLLLRDFVRSLTNKQLDPQSPLSISFYDDSGKNAEQLILSRKH